MRVCSLSLILFLLLSVIAQAQEEAIHHTVVYQQEGEFAGWPANYGIWNWGDEIVVGFVVGYHKTNPKGDMTLIVTSHRSPDRHEAWTEARRGLSRSPIISMRTEMRLSQPNCSKLSTLAIRTWR